MLDVVVLEAAEDVDDGVDLADVAEELVAEPLAIWSAADDPAFTRRLGTAGFNVTTEKVRARANGKGPHHTIWLAARA